MEMVFSDKILEEIFDNVDGKTLRQLLVIKPFRAVILQSHKLMRKLPLIISDENLSERLKIARKIGHQIVKVDFKNSLHVKSSKEIIDILKMLPNLETLILCANTKPNFSAPEPVEMIVPNLWVLFGEAECDLDDHDSITHKCEINRAKFVNLKYLKLDCDDDLCKSILNYISDCDMLDYLYFCWIGSSHMYKICLDFILKQKRLQSLVIAGYNNNVFNVRVDLNQIQNVEFKLEKLEISAQINYDDRFYEFLKTQTSVKELKLYMDTVDYRYFLLIFRKFKKLKKLLVQIDTLEETDHEKLFIEDFKIDSLQELVIECDAKEPSIFSKLINIFPNVKKLNLGNIMKFHCKCLDNLKQLERLAIHLLRFECIFLVKMPSLKHIMVKYLVPFALPEIWEYFAIHNPLLENLIIESGGQYLSTDNAKFELSAIIKSLKHYKKLKCFYIYIDVEESRFDEFLQQPVRVENLLRVVVNKNETEGCRITVSTYFANKCVEDFVFLVELFGRDCGLPFQVAYVD